MLMAGWLGNHTGILLAGSLSGQLVASHISAAAANGGIQAHASKPTRSVPFLCSHAVQNELALTEQHVVGSQRSQPGAAGHAGQQRYSRCVRQLAAGCACGAALLLREPCGAAVLRNLAFINCACIGLSWSLADAAMPSPLVAGLMLMWQRCSATPPPTATSRRTQRSLRPGWQGALLCYDGLCVCEATEVPQCVLALYIFALLHIISCTRPFCLDLPACQV